MTHLTTARRAGAWLGIAGPVAYVLTWAVLGAIRPGYDPPSQAISELAEMGSATGPYMSAAFVVFGLAAIPFAVALRSSLPGPATDVMWAVTGCGLMTMAAAFFPCSPGCPGAGSSLSDNGHAVTATIGYLALMAAPLLTGRALLTHRTNRRFAWWSMVAGGVGSVAMLVWALGLFGDAGGAGQRGFNTLADLWWASAGVWILTTDPLPKD
ncbi:MAG: DUF998 domain-containing protein [Euzebya sp.]